MKTTHSLSLPLAAAVGLTFAGSLPAQDLSPEDQKLLDQLSKLDDSVQKARSGNNVAAVDVIRDAASSDAKAIDLWMDSVHEIDFRQHGKKEMDFHQWKEGQGKKMRDPGVGAAIRLHLQYLLLTIRAAAARSATDRSELAPSLMSFMDDLTRGGRDVLAQRHFIDLSVLGTPIAQRYKLDVTAKPAGDWTLVPSDIGGIYESVILPPLRDKKDAPHLQAMWSKRIAQEGAMAAAADSDFQTKIFKDLTMPRLQWGMARDQFMAGNHAGGAAQMLRIIQENQAHRDAPAWIREMKQLLKGGGGNPEVAGTTAPPVPSDADPSFPPTSAPPDPAPDPTPPPAETKTEDKPKSPGAKPSFPPRFRPPGR